MTQKPLYKPVTVMNGMGLFFKGLLIGIANIIPGVSGGTFALILGVLERLLSALQNLTPKNLIALIMTLPGLKKPSSPITFWGKLAEMDIFFLICLAAGAGVSILGLSHPIDYLLTEYPAYTLSFFLGLLIPTIAVPWKMMKDKPAFRQLIWMIPGMALTIFVAFAFGKTGGFGDNLIWGFLTGVIAICAMILPGISGSFVLLVLGQYQNILRKLQTIQQSLDLGAWIWLIVFAMGCLIGMIAFAKLLKWILEHRRNATLAFLIGLVLGSFWILWPFKNYDYNPDLTHIDLEFQERVAEKKDIQIATAPNILPKSTNDVLWNSLYLVLGLVGALGLNRLGSSSDTDSRQELNTV
ncbi:MAG: DUF368 domain-containing protein [bacterium]